MESCPVAFLGFRLRNLENHCFVGPGPLSGMVFMSFLLKMDFHWAIRMLAFNPESQCTRPSELRKGEILQMIPVSPLNAVPKFL